MISEGRIKIYANFDILFWVFMISFCPSFFKKVSSVIEH